ncbi:unnamed protein product, partial [Heterosigma akashiwo]
RKDNGTGTGAISPSFFEKRGEWGVADSFEAMLAQSVELRTSCDACTSRKVKCQKPKPFSQCNLCKNKGQTCVYSCKGNRGPEPKKPQRTTKRAATPRPEVVKQGKRSRAEMAGAHFPKSACEAQALDCVHAFLAVFEKHFPFVDAQLLKGTTPTCVKHLAGLKSL